MDREHVTLNNADYTIALDHPLDISIPLSSGQNNPNCYYSPPPAFEPIKSGDFIGSVAEGGPCNHHQLYISPHGNGTHTECYGHLSDNALITINQCLQRFHFLAQLVSIQPALDSDGSSVIRWRDLEGELKDHKMEAIVIRTLPNHPEKKYKQYSGSNPPYLEVEIAQQLARRGVLHLLIDLPSIDPEQDAGKLSAHHAFWNYPDNPRADCTITELIYVPDNISDGTYLLNLQIMSLESDASPSKPVLYPIINNSK